jgi:hypothetical protein
VKLTTYLHLVTGLRIAELYFYSPHTSFTVQYLVKHRDNFTFTLSDIFYFDNTAGRCTEVNPVVTICTSCFNVGTLSVRLSQ